MIAGETVRLYEKTQTGTDEYGVPAYTETPVDVSDVLVAPEAPADSIGGASLYGTVAVYTLSLPKGEHESKCWRFVNSTADTQRIERMSDLKRFADAQHQDFETALQEIRSGRKQSHWMWYIFPQIRGLGFSSTSRYYAIQDLREAEDFLADPYLGENLRTICSALLALDTDDPYRVFGSPDDLKLCSSMTLFEAAAEKAGRAEDREIFSKVLEKYYEGRRDQKTLQILNGI